ncbi:MAG: hypothetical protein IOC96_02745 [Rhodobacter sp.]|nr:hypothetical protein [Rhodobacter sp.]MCA3557408.1 hypothetical protein [Rhodobacter sp.]
MGGGVMSDPDLAPGDVEALVRRLGCPPEAPLAMPKQRLERPAAPGLLARLLHRLPVTGGARTSGG